MSAYVNVTSWSARKRHLIATSAATHTLCHAVAYRAGDNVVGFWHAPITQSDIDAMDLCKQCAKAAKVPLGADLPPAVAEGGRPGGEAAATPLAAPRRDADGGER